MKNNLCVFKYRKRKTIRALKNGKARFWFLVISKDYKNSSDTAQDTRCDGRLSKNTKRLKIHGRAAALN